MLPLPVMFAGDAAKTPSDSGSKSPTEMVTDLEDEVWIAMENSAKFAKGDAIELPADAVVRGGRALVQVGYEWLVFARNGTWVVSTDVRAPAASSDGIDDFRPRVVTHGTDGTRFRGYRRSPNARALEEPYATDGAARRPYLEFRAVKKRRCASSHDDAGGDPAASQDEGSEDSESLPDTMAPGEERDALVALDEAAHNAYYRAKDQSAPSVTQAAAAAAVDDKEEIEFENHWTKGAKAEVEPKAGGQRLPAEKDK